MKKWQKACWPRKEPFTSIHLCISHSHAGSVLWHVFLSPYPCSYQAPYVRQALKQEHHMWHLVSWLETDKVISSYLSRKPHYFEPKASWFNFLLELIPYKYELCFIWSFLICGLGSSAPQICMWRVHIGFLCFLCGKQEIRIWLLYVRLWRVYFICSSPIGMGGLVSQRSKGANMADIY